MAGLNKAMIIGNVGNDPDVRSTQSGVEVASLSIATSESWTDKSSGEKKERVQWHKIVIFNENLVKVAKNYIKKGSKVYIEGQIETRKWTDKEGRDQYTTEIVLRPFNGEIVLLDKRDSNAPPASNDPDAYGSMKSSDQPQQKVDELADDIPF